MTLRLPFAAVTCAGLLLAPVIASAQANDPSRASLIARSRLWQPTSIATMDVRGGPEDPDGFVADATITCDYLDKKLEGHSRKFACRIGDSDEVKVKFGVDNGEVYSEVVASRLLWALGFGADRMYPVRVLCRGCPADVGADAGGGARLVDPAVIERKFEGPVDPPGGEDPGWSWAQVELIDDRAGGASRAERDALKLLAVFMQHTDSKPEQQRLVCLDEACARPFLLIGDLGLTFGRANLPNDNALGSANLEQWAATPVWKSTAACVGNLPKSLSGTLKDPVISEEGRRFAADLLSQLSDQQIRDLFDVARVTRREAPEEARSELKRKYTTDEWVTVFKKKRDEIATHECREPWSSIAPPLFGTGPVRWLQSWAAPPLTTLMNSVSLIGYTPAMMGIATLLAFVVSVRAGASMLIVIALTAMCTEALKEVVSFPRPDMVDPQVHSLVTLSPGTIPNRAINTEETYGFPSGHVAAATAFSFGLIYFFDWRWGWMTLAIWVPLQALSRLYLGRHFVGDVLGGVAVGVIITAIALQGLTLRRLKTPAWAARVAWRVFGIAAGLTVVALAIGLPDPHNAGRLLGLAIATVFIAHIAGVDQPVAAAVRARRVALAALLYGVTWWATASVVSALDADVDPVGILVRSALPALTFLAGPLYLERLRLPRFGFPSPGRRVPQ